MFTDPLIFCIPEDDLMKISSSKRASERYAYLFDGCIFLTKPNRRMNSVVGGGRGEQMERRLKESFFLTRVEIHDKEDAEDWKNLFEIAPRDQPPILLSAPSFETKRNWMSILVMLTTKRYPFILL